MHPRGSGLRRDGSPILARHTRKSKIRRRFRTPRRAAHSPFHRLFLGVTFGLWLRLAALEAAGLGIDLALVAIEFEGLRRAARLRDLFRRLLGELAGDHREL